MSRQRKNRRWQLVIAWVLMTLQMHLLMVTILHHHGSDLFPWGPATVRTANHVPQSGADSTAPCPACQIARHNAVRPALRSPIPQVILAAPLLREFTSSYYHPLLLAAVFGRAPPQI